MAQPTKQVKSNFPIPGPVLINIDNKKDYKKPERHMHKAKSEIVYDQDVKEVKDIQSNHVVAKKDNKEIKSKVNSDKKKEEEFFSNKIEKRYSTIITIIIIYYIKIEHKKRKWKKLT